MQGRKEGEIREKISHAKFFALASLPPNRITCHYHPSSPFPTDLDQMFMFSKFVGYGWTIIPLIFFLPATQHSNREKEELLVRKLLI